MSVKILFITNRYFFQPTVDALSRLDPPCETNVVVYNSFDHITQVYDQHADAYDAVFISGTSAKHRIEMKYPRTSKPLIAYQVDSDALHRDILRLAIETQNLDFRRIAVDFLLPLDNGYSVVDFLQLDSIAPVLSHNALFTETVPEQAQPCPEQIILDRITALWESGEIDMVFCLYAIIVPSLQEREIPFRCPFISDDHLNRLIQDALIRIELNRLHENHPAVIQIFPRHSGPDYSRQLQQIRLHLEQYTHDNLIDWAVQNAETCCTIISSMKILRYLTNDFQVCQISSYLTDRLDFPVAVGYGVGTTIFHATNNAQIASKEAKIIGQSFLVDSNGTLIGPMNSEKRMVISSHSMPSIGEIAKRCNLSAMTIQKLTSIVRNNGSDKLTTHDLAKKLDTTVRNANRIMQNLCKGGVAKAVYTQASHSRGRPVQVYKLALNVDFP